MLLIKNALHLGAPVDLAVSGGKIVTMTPADHVTFENVEEEIDALGMWLMPACIDAHTHLRDPGFEYKEDIDTGLDAAAHGGFGHIMCMANTKPVNDNATVTRYMLDKAIKTHPHGPGLHPVAAATIGLAGTEMAPLAELKQAGCIATSNDGVPVANTDLVRHIMEYAADLKMIFIDHCEDPWLAKGWIMNEGQISGLMGLKGQPAPGEAIQAMRDILLAQYLNVPVHIAHVSSAMTVELIAWAKDKGIPVTAETCPHYLLLTENAVENYNPQAKVSPPLRSLADQQALRKAVKTGIIDILVTDHAPHAAHEKNDVLQDAPNGFIGLELALPLTFSLIAEEILNQADLHRLWCMRPAAIFDLPCCDFNPGSPADFILYDPCEEWEINRENIFSKSSNSPFWGQKLKGRVKHHWHSGYMLF